MKAPAPTETGGITTGVGSDMVLCQIVVLYGNLHKVLVIVIII